MLKRRFRERIVIWTCKNCGMTFQGTSHPSYSGCPNGGHHKWIRTTM